MFNGFGFVGEAFRCKFCGGIGFHGLKGKSQFSVLSVATDITSTEQVGKRFSIAVPNFLLKKKFMLYGSYVISFGKS
jgi:hypothetical protein